MQKKYIKELSLLTRSQEDAMLKRDKKVAWLWRKLPYRVRLRIEHICFVSSVIMMHWNAINPPDFLHIRENYHRRLAKWYNVISRLKTLWYRSTPVQFSKGEESPQMRAFLNRVSNINHFQN